MRKTLSFVIFFIGKLFQTPVLKCDRVEDARTALEYVERVRNSACTGGTEETLPVQFDHSVWDKYASVAMRMSNLLTKIYLQGNSSLGGVTDEFLFNLVRNNVDDDSPIFGSAIAVEEWVYPKYRIFCPYAYHKGGVTFSHDISLNYNYLSNATEWYHVLRKRDWSEANVTVNFVTYRYNESSHDVKKEIEQPMAVLEDGYWTLPYYDCGGGDIWMVTYSSPILGLEPSNNSTTTPVFRGIGTIDIELTDIDINQCDLPSDSTTGESVQEEGSIDVFRGTHHCLSSTMCKPVSGRGFVPGAYRCFCQKGYYFPSVNLPAHEKYFSGEDMERFFTNSSRNDTSDLDLTLYQCLKCAEGCEACVDSSPCLYSFLYGLRVSLLTVTVIILTLVLVCSLIVHLYKDKRAIKSASPMFLQIMTAGAALMCLPMFIMFPEPSQITCIVSVFPKHIGFSLLYGALLLKTWRISMVFKVKSARKVNLSDRVLAQRFVPIIGVAVAYLAAWTAVGTPEVVWRVNSSELKFKDCSNTFWGILVYVGEGVFLLWGAYLCYVVRKAPSHFNESKYITWSIYNNIILGTFILITRHFIATSEGPDILYVVDFVYLNVSVTCTICLIFVPKIYALNQIKGGADAADSDANSTVTGFPKTQLGTSISAAIRDRTETAAQTDLTGIDMHLGFIGSNNTHSNSSGTLLALPSSSDKYLTLSPTSLQKNNKVSPETNA